jgi:D-sedoheptulose 7-phosphate isomerase
MIKSRIRHSIGVKEQLLNDAPFQKNLENIALLLVEAYRQGGKVLFCGNGGSAADAQHLAAELSGRFYFDRPPLDAEALHVNTSYITAVANDYHFDEVYARLILSRGKGGDVLIAISTSGNSPNLIKAIEVANEIGMVTVGLTGKTGGKMAPLCSHILSVPSTDTPRIQEAQIMIGHIICEIVESTLFPK